MPDKDIILIGGGESSKIIIASLMNSLKHRVRGVLFIDHDEETIRELYEDMDQYGDDDLQVRDVRLHKRVLDREKFDKIAKRMGILGGGVTWEDPLPNHPPMVRVQTDLWGKEILDKLWDMMPTVGADDTHTGRLDQMRVVLVFLFGMTGMTSSTVGVESAVVLRKKLRARLLNHRDDDASDEADAVINSTLDKGSMPLFVGVGCFPPDPTDGAGQYNVLHGLRVAGVIKDKLPELNLPREAELVGKPFNKFFLLDGSGAWRTQDIKEDYSEWVARTLSTLLTCQSVDAEPDDDTFYDSIEMLDSCEPFSHVGLVMAGLMQQEHELFDKLRHVKDYAPQVYPEAAPQPDVSLLRSVINNLEGTNNEQLDQMFNEVRGAARSWRRAQSSIPTSRWFWPFGRAKRRRAIAVCGDAKLRLRSLLSDLPCRINQFVEDYFDKEWGKKSHQGIWAMPMPAKLWLTDKLQDSLPLRDTGDTGNDYTVIQDRNKSRQETHDMVRMLMRHLIDPMTVHPMEIEKGTMMLVGSNDVKRDYPLPDPEDMTTSFGGEWTVLMSEHIAERNPMHLLLWWRPVDGDVRPMFYRVDDSIKVADLPGEYDAWPQPSESIHAAENADAQA